ncbi:MAG TPA: hypothetical protein VHO25_10285 [Polyangiaceae bacterium]|nr:hypothetical protein [Polyangiaceae bacterium]
MSPLPPSDSIKRLLADREAAKTRIKRSRIEQPVMQQRPQIQRLVRKSLATR